MLGAGFAVFLEFVGGAAWQDIEQQVVGFLLFLAELFGAFGHLLLQDLILPA